MSNQHSYGLPEWQAEQLKGMTPEQLHAEHAATSVDDYQAKVEAEFKRRRLPVPEKAKPKRSRRAKK